ncbi:hypothetical protein ABMA75_09585 [Halobacteriovorax sp. ZH4_bin.1]|uniref:hypothetical protein n=1 Tax=unclassified Halobacteriovorax TaxID=2639665 RepID=UPI003716AE41
MSRLIILTIIGLLSQKLCFAQASSDKLFEDLRRISKKEEKVKTKAKPRFKYIKNNLRAKTFRSVILANSLIESLDGKSYYRIQKNTIIRTKEVSPGSRYFFILPNDGSEDNVKYVTLSTNLDHLETILTFNNEKFTPFDQTKFKAIEYDKKQIHTYTQIRAGLGNSTPNFFLDNISLSSTTIAAEAGVETFENIPVFLSAEYLAQNSGQEVQFTSFSVGLRIEYRYHINENSFIAAGLSAQRSLYTSATINDLKVGHTIDSFGLNVNYNYAKYFIGLDLKKQNYAFDSNVVFPAANLTNDNSATAISINIGKEFEVSI